MMLLAIYVAIIGTMLLVPGMIAFIRKLRFKWVILIVAFIPSYGIAWVVALIWAIWPQED